MAVRVNPFHEIEIAEGILPLLQRPSQRDFVIRNLSKKMANGQPLIQGELVVAGRETRESYPLASEYPIHFRKTYYPTCFHQDPELEFLKHQMAAEVLRLPPPIGWTKTTFRSCFIPGLAYQKLSPFGVEPPEQNIQIGEKVAAASLFGLWELLIKVHAQITTLHQNGMVHGDLFLHNVIVSRSPVGVFLIDFEKAQRRQDVASDEDWSRLQTKDFEEIWRMAIFLQCALGLQAGPLATQALEHLDRLFPKPDVFRRRLEAVNFL